MYQTTNEYNSEIIVLAFRKEAFIRKRGKVYTTKFCQTWYNCFRLLKWAANMAISPAAVWQSKLLSRDVLSSEETLHNKNVKTKVYKAVLKAPCWVFIFILKVCIIYTW